MIAYMSHGFKTAEWADSDPGSTGTYTSYYSETETWPYEAYTAADDYDSRREEFLLQLMKNSYVRPIPKIEWKLTPVRSTTIRPEMRIKQPVSRTGFKRGNRG